jgi:SAM-dependent methyltransferase
MRFKDHFSQQAPDYARYRPDYPPALFALLAGRAPARRLAWDVGTGSGQAAVALAEHFDRVIGTDASAAQIAQATAHPRVAYRVEPAERTSLSEASVDLVTVAQALHWLDLDHFYREAGRVLKPRGLLAVWCYGLSQIAPGVDEVVRHYYDEVVGPYWPPERHHIEARYQTLAFPFPEQSAPAFFMHAQWRLDDYLGYLGTWSATQRYRKEQGTDPLPTLRAALGKQWGDAATPREIRWPLYLRLGTKE